MVVKWQTGINRKFIGVRKSFPLPETILLWGHARIPAKITGQKRGVREIQTVGQLGDRERRGAKQAFELANGEVGNPIRGHLSGGLPDHFRQMPGG